MPNRRSAQYISGSLVTTSGRQVQPAARLNSLNPEDRPESGIARHLIAARSPGL
jgi:hypothetical protein